VSSVVGAAEYRAMADHLGRRNATDPASPVVPLEPYHGFLRGVDKTLCGRAVRPEYVVEGMLLNSYHPSMRCEECITKMDNA
jgi:hypothetical protein